MVFGNLALDLSFQNCGIVNCGIVMTKVYCSISKTVVFKNFVPKQGLIVQPPFAKVPWQYCLNIVRKLTAFAVKTISFLLFGS
jgi:hypothetical protein